MTIICALYIPHGSDNTVNCLSTSINIRTSFISHMVQIILLVSGGPGARPFFDLYIPHGSDNTIAEVRIPRTF